MTWKTRKRLLTGFFCSIDHVSYKLPVTIVEPDCFMIVIRNKSIYS